MYTVSRKKVGRFYFYDNFCKSGPIVIIVFTVKFRRHLRRKLELKLPPSSLTSVTAPPSEAGVSTTLQCNLTTRKKAA